MDIKIYGMDSRGHQMVTNLMTDLLQKAKIPFNISEIQDVSLFLEKKIESIPAIQMNDEPIIGLKSNGSFNNSLRDVVNQILSSENYGDLAKFIIPVDFSDTSINALSYGHRLATDMGAVTKVVHVYKPSPTLTADTTIHVASQKEKEQQLIDLVKSFDKDWGGDILKASLVSSEFKVGFATERILDSVDDNAGEMIIIGSTGESDILKRWFGSTSLEVSARATCPVLLVPAKAHYKGISKVLLAIGPDGIDKEIMAQLSSICSQFSPDIYIAHVTNDPKVNLDLISLKAELPGISFTSVVIKSDEVVAGLEDYAIVNDIDIIALAPRRKSLFTSFLNKSVTEEMAIKSSIPILILK